MPATESAPLLRGHTPTDWVDCCPMRMTKAGRTEPHPATDKLGAILKICQKMNSERDLNALLDVIAREATRLLEAERASIFLLDPDKRELWSKVALGSDEILRFDARLGIAGAAAMSGKTINVVDAYEDARFHTAIDSRTGYRTRTILAVPLRDYEGEIVGSFEVLNKRGGRFNEEDEEILKSLAAHVAIAVETAQLVADLTRKHEELAKENTQLWREVEGRFSTEGIVGTSEKIQNVVRTVERIRDSSVGVLITGESGTGKEMVARAIHFTSPRARRSFVALNCAALPETLVESELFGIEKGVATGVEARIGRFEMAVGGTLFLDEIGDLSLAAQAKILRVLQERVVERLGGRKSIPVDVRVLAATNKDLEAEIKKGNFREDLYYRLNVVHIRMPALREIREDIPLLADYFVAECCREMNKEPLKLTPRAIQRLVQAAWPGNVRQLQNKIKRAVVFARHKAITEADLEEGIPDFAGEPPSGGYSLQAAVEGLEKRMIQEALEVHHHNQQRAAIALGLSRQGLINKMKRYGITAGRQNSRE